ncbi:metal-dependent hydrolase [Marinobacterium nitratireducens]|uniref:Metal-dependent hydrolase n=1 Tax=Marinobacterium nitratireducens TaxID=518897 RepID=A0A918DRE0_9GAMM|nr:TatD family hydrolase [Marinobacterium nitratireducens]GGO78782.1 metal-dependent hydrolase [Marinobacterium nitratireducens]
MNAIPSLFDSHCHLDFPAFDGWRDTALAEARAAGVTEILVPGVTAEHWERVERLCASDPRLYPALGLHPCFLSEHRPEHLEQLATRLAAGTARAVGEIGLDYFIDNADRDQQQFYLEAQLDLAARHDLPVLLHVRKAHDQMLKALRRAKLRRAGIVHAFSGSEQQAQQYIELGFKLGFGGAISYDRATKLRRLASALPLDALVLETDAPDMPLAGWRDEPNRPQRVRDTFDVLCALRAEPPGEIARRTTANVHRLLAI